jgi:hypothetical protein
MKARMFAAVLGPLVAVVLASPALARAAEDAASPPEAPAEPPRPRGELALGVSLAGGTTDWRGDAAAYGGIAIGLRLFGVITPFAEARVGYGVVDQRLLTYLSLGVEAGFFATKTVYPRALVGFVHQHEESMASVAEEPAGALLGIGNGIRHRAGVQFGLGCDFTLLRRPKVALTLGPELVGAYLGYSSGPNLYGFIGARFGTRVALF